MADLIHTIAVPHGVPDTVPHAVPGFGAPGFWVKGFGRQTEVQMGRNPAEKSC